ncbi:SET domain-containing protein [Amylocystis lapponica]|nr:SET domain-containing protein [Amylocystis lapponica]
MQAEVNLDPFVRWFCDHNGSVDTNSMGFADFPGHGRGAVALRDIPEGHTLFTIPRALTLSTRTSSLPARLGKATWAGFGLDIGWSGLILCMMWEEAQGAASMWSEYFDILPAVFDTPMFWSEDDLQELKGTAVVDKIGREDAERDYKTKVVPALESRPDIFPVVSISRHYSLERYHIMGSRILSRSFQVERWKEDDNEDSDSESSQEQDAHNTSAMDVDEPAGVQDADPDQENVDEDDDDAESSADIAMVPMADMLNARFESENAKLFHERHELRMMSTRPINAGEQIWNTYGDPPNSDLLRRYGHVDIVPLRPPLVGQGNPEDVVEIRADLVVSVASQTATENMQERVDWWLEEADDDTFVMGADCQLPEDLVSFIRLLLLSKEDWDKASAKSKLPKAKVDAGVLSIAARVLVQRMKEYPTTIEEDEILLSPENAENIAPHKKHAVIVRLGEKRILFGASSVVTQLQDALTLASEVNSGKKRGRDNRGVESDSRAKKAKR